jgi:hypothetical protein
MEDTNNSTPEIREDDKPTKANEARKLKITKLYRKARREGKTIKESLRDAGFSESQAQKGRGKLHQSGYLAKVEGKLAKQEERKLMALGQKFSDEELAQLVIGRLTKGTITGEDAKGSIRSAELLGKTRKLNLFEPEQSVGVFNMQIPAGWEDRYLTTPDTKTIDAEVIEPPKQLDAAPSDVVPNDEAIIKPGMIAAKPEAPRASVEVPESRIPADVPKTLADNRARQAAEDAARHADFIDNWLSAQNAKRGEY